MAVSRIKASAQSHVSNGVHSTRLYKSRARSKVTNGVSILPQVDGRTFWVRRYRDVYALLLSERAGASEGEKMTMRRIACLEVELERRETMFAETGEASDNQIEVYQRSSNSQRRLLDSLGERRPKDVTPPVPTLNEYLARRRTETSEAAE